MHRYEMMLNDLDMSEEADRQQKVRHSSSTSLNLAPFISCKLMFNLQKIWEPDLHILSIMATFFFV